MSCYHLEDDDPSTPEERAILEGGQGIDPDPDTPFPFFGPAVRRAVRNIAAKSEASASTSESTISGERANNRERTTTEERATPGESTTGEERATPLESTKYSERPTHHTHRGATPCK